MREIHSLAWQRYNIKQHACLPMAVTAWLLHAGSFMQNLKAHGVANPQVKLIQQAWQLPMRDERKILALGDRHPVLIREVLIYDNDIDLMYARTVFPAKTLTGKERCLAQLKNRSLGSVLFKNPHLKRSEFELACLTAAMPKYQKILSQSPLKSEQLWARRSVFYIGEKSLLLEEVLLPGMNKLWGSTECS